VHSDRTLISCRLHDPLSNSAAFGGETLLQNSCSCGALKWTPPPPPPQSQEEPHCRIGYRVLQQVAVTLGNTQNSGWAEWCVVRAFIRAYHTCNVSMSKALDSKETAALELGCAMKICCRDPAAYWEIKSKLHSGDVCYNCTQNLVSVNIERKD
jgi:hypothetical protein